MDLKNFDKRIVERNIRKNIISRQDYRSYISSLPDLESQLEIIDIEASEEEEAEQAEKADATGQPEDAAAAAADGPPQPESKEPVQ